MMALIIIAGILVVIPLGYINSFLLVTLLRKAGFMKFIIILIVYLLFWALIVLLLSEGYIGLPLFFLLPVLLNVMCVCWLKKDFIEALRSDIEKITGRKKEREKN